MRIPPHCPASLIFNPTRGTMILAFAVWYAFAAVLVIGGMVLYLDRYKKRYPKEARKIDREVKRRGQKLLDFDAEHPDQQALKYNENLNRQRRLLAGMLAEAQREQANLKRNLILLVGLWTGLLLVIACLAIFVP